MFRLLVFVYLGIVLSGYAQSISRPTFPFTNACASDTFNTYTVTASFSSGSFSNENIFTLQLSNEYGSFLGEVTDIDTAITDLTTSQIIFNDFSFPITVKGDNYRLRIVASEGGITSTSSNSFAAYYHEDIRYELNPRCLSGSGTFVATPSDLDSYLWYKDGVLIEGEIGNTLQVDTLGEYYFKTDLGDCNNIPGAPKSNLSYVVTQSLDPIEIIGEDTYNVCSEETILLTSSEINNTWFYKWYKDGVRLFDIVGSNFTVSGSTTSSLSISGIDMEGEYRLEVAVSILDNCSRQSQEVGVYLLNPSIQITSEETLLLLPPGIDKQITAEVLRGDDPEITWYRDGVQVQKSSNTDLLVTQEGLYTVSITDATTGCNTDTIVFANQQVNAIQADDISITIDYATTTYSDCSLGEVTLKIDNITAIVDEQEYLFETDQLTDISIFWLRDGEIAFKDSNEYTIDTASENGTYTAVLVIGDQEYISNELPVILSVDSFQIHQSNDNLVNEDSLTLSLGLVDTENYIFQWVRNNVDIITGATNESYEVTEVGLYSVEVTSVDCIPVVGEEEATKLIGPLAIDDGVSEIPNIITPNDDGINDHWVLPEKFTEKTEYSVNIFTPEGKLDFSANNYDGEWPVNSETKASKSLYYYVINKEGILVEKGSITVIR